MEDVPKLAIETTDPGTSPHCETAREEDDAVCRAARRWGEADKKGT